MWLLAVKQGQRKMAEMIPWRTLGLHFFAPAYNPQIVITVLSENSGEGSNVAAPIAKKILDNWFGR